MTITTARIKRSGKNFEILVNLDEALNFKNGKVSSVEAQGDKIFTDSKRGMTASKSDIKETFGTENIQEVIEKIVKSGEILVTKEYRDEERERKFRQIVDFLAHNAVDPHTGNPHSSERIKNALEQANVNIKNIPIENQIKEIISKISGILPIKIGTKKIRVTVPAVHTGKAYGVIDQYQEHEAWLSDGSLEAVLNIPVGIIMDFYDKLNAVTHGSALTEEIKEKNEQHK